jgi:hypothetical protein
MSNDVSIHSNRLKLYGISYFHANAPSVQIGAVRDTEVPLLQQNCLAVQDYVPSTKLKIRRALTLKLNASSVTANDISVSVTAPKLGALTAEQTSQTLRDDTPKLVLFEVSPIDLVDAANQRPVVLATLKRVGSDGRLVHKVVTLMEASTAISASSAAMLSASGASGGITITAGGSTSAGSATQVDLSRSTFTFLLLKPKWDAVWKLHWQRIDDLEEDQWSTG